MSFEGRCAEDPGRSGRIRGLRWILAPVLAAMVQAEADAQWSLEGETNLFYTDDVSLFSASRRLALREDPTQPVLDITGQGEDMVFEPLIRVGRRFDSSLGPTELSFKSQGFVFAQNPAFNHGTYRASLVQKFKAGTIVRLNYYYAPNLFLGNNEERRTGTRQITGERVTSHYWSTHVEQPLTGTLGLRLLGRYGVRTYNEAFSERDTRFWTIGPHLDWEISKRAALTLGYHYERGLADGRNQPQFSDDISYINHYVSAELVVALVKETSLIIDFDYERNNFTSNLPGDKRRGAHEDIFQGTARLRRALGRNVAVTVGYQRSQRKASFEESTVIDSNVWIGGEYRY